MAGNNGLNLVSYKDELDHVRPIALNSRYGIGSTTKAETQFRQWEIVFLLAYTPYALNFVQFKYLFITHTTVFENHTNNGCINVQYKRLAVKQISPNQQDVRSGSRRHNSPFYLSGEVFG